MSNRMRCPTSWDYPAMQAIQFDVKRTAYPTQQTGIMR
jgi:hypothetical protein